MVLRGGLISRYTKFNSSASYNEVVMKRVLAEFPYNEYFLYVVLHKKEGRRYANLIPVDKSKKRKTISYARYLMSVKEKRILECGEEVDHIDNKKLNDSFDNLQIISSYQNKIKEMDRRGKCFVVMKCPYCHKIFEKEKRNTYLDKGGRFTACSVECKNKFVSMLFTKGNEKMCESLIKEIFINEYKKVS